ncbi:MAG: S26 family signal peptidase [Mariprofundales bacterium]
MKRLVNFIANIMTISLWFIGIVLVLNIALSPWYELRWNITPSLPGKLFVIQKAVTPIKGDMATYTIGKAFGPYPADFVYMKILAGAKGDEVWTTDIELRENDPRRTNPNYSKDGVCKGFFIGYDFLGCAKLVSKDGVLLDAGPTGVIPSNHWYVQGTHPDSFDSRYALVGWPRSEQVFGRAVRVW